MYETRRELLRKIQDLFTDLNQCEVELESKKEEFSVKKNDQAFYACVSTMGEQINSLIRNRAYQCDVDDNKRRLDRLEEMMYHLCDSIDKKEDDNTYYKLTDQQGVLKKKAKEIYEEQAAFRGDQDE